MTRSAFMCVRRKTGILKVRITAEIVGGRVQGDVIARNAEPYEYEDQVDLSDREQKTATAILQGEIPDPFTVEVA